KPIQPGEDVLLDIVTSEIQDKLVAAFGTRPPGEVHNPVRVLPIKIAVGIDHFGLYPQPEVHAEAMDPINERLESVGKLLRVDIPIAEPGVIIVALPEPAIINDEPFYPKPRGFLCKRHLPGLIDIELGRFP